MKEKYRIRHGGLMRCCLASLDDAMVAADDAPNEKDTFACKYCGNPMVFQNGAWEWGGAISSDRERRP